MEAIDGVIYLARCAVNETVPERTEIEGLDIEAVYCEASRHMIAALVGMALKDCGIETQAFKQAIAAAQRKTIILENERKKVFCELDKVGVWHMALKGSVLKDWYPLFGMRESADCNILFDKEYEEKVKTIMTGLGFSCKSYGKGHHDVYIKKPITNMQMHVDLFGLGYGKRLNDYYENVKDRLRLKAGHEYCFTPEDFYIYMIAHEWDHYEKAGAGLRSVIDTYVMLKKHDYDMNYVTNECEKLGIRDFEEKNRSLAMHLFGTEKLTEEDKAFLHYVIQSGTYGTIAQHVEKGIRKNGGRLRYLFHRLILPMEIMRIRYPMFYKYKVLLPALPVIRVYKALKSGKAERELRAVINS